MADTGDTPLIETTPPPAVSNLRSKFEQLAVQASSPSPKSPAVRSSVLPASPRPRVLEFADIISDAQRPTLRPISSASDLRSSSLRPSPSPVSDSPSAPSSPRLRPTPSSLHVPAPDPMKPTASLRKPPPPPPPHTRPSATPSPRPELNSTPARSATMSQFNGSVPHTSSPFEAESSRTPNHSLRTSPPRTSSATPPRVNGSLLVDSTARDVPRERRVPPPRPPRPSQHLDTQSTSSLDIRHEHAPSSESSLVSDHSSRSSSESDSLLIDVSPSPTLPPRPTKPPRPPVRAVPVRSATVQPVASSSSFIPPPLPARKTILDDNQNLQTHTSPTHQTSFSDEAPSPSDSVASTSTLPMPGRKAFGAHLPPPTRTIALGDKLPAPRRQQSGSSSESEDDDIKARIDLLPDSSRSSRRPPVLRCHTFDTNSIHVPAYTGVAAVAGHVVVVGTHHHLKIYNLSVQEKPLFNIDTRSIAGETKSKDNKVTCMEFRPAVNSEDRARYLWVGTKEGHLFEVDVANGVVSAVKFSAHASSVTHIFRHAGCMATVDEHGKVLVFSGDPSSGTDVSLSYSQPRIARIQDKQDFVKILNGQLWTSNRDVVTGPGGRPARGCAAVRIYDIFSPTFSSKNVAPSEPVGSVLSGASLPTMPGKVFLGHEGGHVTIWGVGANGEIHCEEVVKVSASDVLCLEGVNNRLWAGGRQGTIAAYDVAPRPWVMTNCWMAHQKLTVQSMTVDPWSMEKVERLCVYSIGRDERLYFWDGLLGVDWIDQELGKREKEYSSFRDMNVLIVSFNLDSAKPDQLVGSPENVNFLEDALRTANSPDIIAFGLQEVIDLESRKMAAKNFLLANKKNAADGGISQKVSTAYKKWFDRLVLAVRVAMPTETPYTVIHSESLVGLLSVIFIKVSERNSLKNIGITTVKRGMGGRYGNKGGIISRFVIDDSSLCFINCHLAAGQSHVRQRNADVAAMLEDKSLFPATDIMMEDPVAFVNGGDGSMVLDHEIVFLNGDMNYRIDLRRDVIINDIYAGNYHHLFSQDQLLKEMATNRGFRLRSFLEGPITFPPTYKYDRRSNTFDSSEKARSPAWCDRILWRSNDQSRVEQLDYRRYEVNVSDHRPVSSAFRMTVKSVHHELRAGVKAEVSGEWIGAQKKLLAEAMKYYQAQMMICGVRESSERGVVRGVSSSLDSF
ncbi:Endonuclease/exonuclease/phosphatase [Cristinia sonorae]|uniref:Endonuclease/exonuclease/phosphatase n=1 Tax=Cristinia sonorae TaxID=1940300 RepID=A0A8K0XTN0_9AGAR|nr:Endonuclease/exonuclease/phosphatase [Cristinia sonorae]